METFLMVYFVLVCLVTITRFLNLHTRVYPYKFERTKEMELVSILVGIGMATWAGILLFGN